MKDIYEGVPEVLLARLNELVDDLRQSPLSQPG